jgi:hypothetical protein
VHQFAAVLTGVYGVRRWLYIVLMPSKGENWKITTDVAVAAEGDTRRWTVRYSYPDRRALATIGPVCYVNWCVSDEFEAALAAAGERVPEPVAGYALIDIGAMESCLSLPAVDALKLEKIGDANHFGAHGQASLPTYNAHLILAFQAVGGERTTVEKKGRFAALHQLEQYFDQFRARDNVGGPQTHVGVIGRDVLQYMTLTYAGSGAVTLSWTEAAIANVAFDAWNG